MKKLDSYAHILPEEYFQRMLELTGEGGAFKRWTTLPVLHDLDQRLRMMDEFPGYQQVLTLSSPPIELVAPADLAPGLARLANDGMAEIAARHPDRFPAFVAALPLNDVEASLAEMHRAVTDLGARGIQVFTNVNGRPLDDPEFWPLFEAAALRYDIPVWMHPARGAGVSDYATEDTSKFEIWWTFGWPYETSAAMTRMVFSGFFDKLPGLRVITHHMGAMIPFFDGRIGPGLDQLGSRTEGDELPRLLGSLSKRPIDFFRMFYADTALAGGRSGLRCGLDFFGSEQVLFATDCPFDPEGGPGFIRSIPAAIESLDLSQDELEQIFFRNAERLLKLDTSEPVAGQR